MRKILFVTACSAALAACAQPEPTPIYDASVYVGGKGGPTTSPRPQPKPSGQIVPLLPLACVAAYDGGHPLRHICSDYIPEGGGNGPSGVYTPGDTDGDQPGNPTPPPGDDDDRDPADPSDPGDNGGGGPGPKPDPDHPGDEPVKPEKPTKPKPEKPSKPKPEKPSKPKPEKPKGNASANNGKGGNYDKTGHGDNGKGQGRNKK